MTGSARRVLRMRIQTAFIHAPSAKSRQSPMPYNGTFVWNLGIERGVNGKTAQAVEKGREGPRENRGGKMGFSVGFSAFSQNTAGSVAYFNVFNVSQRIAADWHGPVTQRKRYGNGIIRNSGKETP